MKALKKISLFTRTCLSAVSMITGALAADDPNVSVVKIFSTDSASTGNQSTTVEYYSKPFSIDSLWNSRPISPSFSNFVIPTSKYHPLIDSGAYSSGCFLADSKSAPVNIVPAPGQKGVYDADAEVYQPRVVIPHWPDNLEAATGGDGHADIYDVSSGIVHSFWKLKKIDGVWTANLYAWSPINGSGWGNPAHYYQGARAVGIGACAGIIRKAEFESTDSIYPHALAMSLAQNGAGKGYVYPATSADNYSSTNTGQIPEGALVMLPGSFDISSLKTPELIKIARTLKVYGAYIVDTNDSTPFVIYAEMGSGLNLHKNGYNLKAVNDLHLIRQSLRMVTDVKSWVDGFGKPFTPEKNLNILSMRGSWSMKRGNTWDFSDPMIGKYNTWKQAIVFGPTTTPLVQSINSGRAISQVHWAKPKAGERFKLTAITTGGGKLRLIIYDKQWKTRVDTYNIENGQSISFEWPAGELFINLTATSGVGKGSSVGGTLLRVK